MLMIRGLPPRVSLSEGRSFSSGVWAVPLSSIGKLEMAPANGTSGRSDLRIELVTLDGRILADKVATLYILAPGVASDNAADGKRKADSLALTVGPIPARPDPATGSTQTPASLGPSMAREVENARAMMRKGDENMQSGKIAVARLFYKSAAESGYAPAALALGATYDGRRLAQWKVVGQQADPAQARKWYEKARELGAPEAELRLRELGGG
jgi:TPR repeat protein